MNEFLLVFEMLDDNVFQTIHYLKNHLNIVCRGKYDLKIEFNQRQNDLSKKYNLRGAPALINLNNHRIVYGSKIDRWQVKKMLENEQGKRIQIDE
ncbi:MAG: hypothetical protein ACD_62C00592G0008 [uncultured bacterium]|nr:MAG: hypothetical protein ACD_62C00592G0008 [uncultured bacterium]